MLIYIVLYAIDSLNSSSFTVVNRKKQSQCHFQLELLSSVELANNQIFLLEGKNNFIKLIVWFIEVKA